MGCCSVFDVSGVQACCAAAPTYKQSVFTKTPHRLYNLPPTMRVLRVESVKVCVLCS